MAQQTADRLWTARERGRAEAALRESEKNLAALVEALPLGVGLLDTNGEIALANTAYTELVPQRIPSRDPDRLGLWQAWTTEGTPVDPRDFPGARALRGEHVLPGMEMLFGVDNPRWKQVSSIPIRNAKGEITGMVSAIADIDALKRSQAALRENEGRLNIVVAELQHRTRNLLGVIRAIADRMMERATSLEEFREGFRDRLEALSRANSLLSRLQEGDRVRFSDLLQAELRGMGVTDGQQDQVTLEGPDDVRLRSATVQTLALGLHELLTNAIKYGALASSSGHLTVRWQLREADGGTKLEVSWRESGVAMAAGAEGRRGYGRELIENALPYQLDASTRYTLTPDGVHCVITLPMSKRTN